MAEIIQKTDGRTAVLSLESVQLQNNIIMITGEINDESVREWQSMLLYLISQMTPEQSQNTPIQLYINSPGGEVYSGLGLYDMIQHIKQLGYIVSTFNIGVCASMASIILMSGSEGYRKAFANSSVMIHELSYGDWGKLSEMQDSTKEGERVQNIINNIITKHTSFPVTEALRKDVWMGTSDALNYNIIDEIL